MPSRNPARDLLRASRATIVLALLFGRLGSADATTMIDFSLEDLAAMSHACVRVMVISTHAGDTVTQFEVRVIDRLYGATPADTFLIPLDMSVVGMPHLTPGDDVLIFLNFRNRIERVLGLQWGTIRIVKGGVLSYDHMPLALSKERVRGRDRTFLRASTAAIAPLRYQELRQVILHIRAALAAEGFPLLPEN